MSFYIMLLRKLNSGNRCRVHLVREKINDRSSVQKFGYHRLMTKYLGHPRRGYVENAKKLYKCRETAE